MNWKELLMRLMRDRFYNHFFYYYLHLKKGQFPKILNLKNPTTFNEKTIWLKVNQRYVNAHIIADKVLVKNFVKQKVGEKYLIPNIAVFGNVSQIEIDKLPASFVLKANHGSGWNIICPDKKECNMDAVKKKLSKWLNTNYYDIGKEYQYRDIVPMILCEAYMEDSKENPLIDYKIFCFSGKPAFIQVDLDRHINHTRNFYDIKWNLLPFTTLYPLGKRRLPRPDGLDEMLFIAEKLSDEFKFARIDLFFHNREIYFGEITLHHGGGFEPFIPSEYDYVLGNYITL
ncbi:ATP-grasp fold amidoligase family protein [Candidatus Magnetominusculus dajiuhuensis]|uniref:ATP-grasp fold amidoligase family protein n=1 Tax=Candidatus Magnetominusculus dajiuhuensis TaxID=3137712 RepID=UPI003B42B6A3